MINYLTISTRQLYINVIRLLLSLGAREDEALYVMAAQNILKYSNIDNIISLLQRDFGWTNVAIANLIHTAATGVELVGWTNFKEDTCDGPQD